MAALSDMQIEVFDNSGRRTSMIDPNENAQEVEFSMSSNQSVDGFPTMKFRANVTKQFAGLPALGKEFELLVRLKAPGDGAESVFFRGAYLKDTFEIEKDRAFPKIEIELIHPFFKTTILAISQRSFIDFPFYSFLEELIAYSKISCKLTIPDDLRKICINGFVTNMSSFRLVKEVCLQNRLLIDFRPDGSIELAKRDVKIAGVLGQTPITLTEKDFISMKGQSGM